MAEHIIDYLAKYGDVTFDELPFGEVDALILSQFSYLKLENVIPRLKVHSEALSMAEIADKMEEAEVFSDERYEQDNRALWQGMMSGRRFGTMSCNYLADETDDTIAVQFCAFTVFLQGYMPIILFRGTDETIVGWKEDFNMAFAKPIPGQRMALMYVNQVSLRLDGEFTIAGHSKGGNFAVYSAMAAAGDVRERIASVYSFDGPGFRSEILEENHYAEIADKISKYIPKSSLVGLILENSEDYEVVNSSVVGGALQHNPYTWLVDDTAFTRLDDVHLGAKVRNQSLNQWVNDLSEGQLQVLVDSLFHVIEAAGVETTTEISADMKKSAMNMIKATADIDDETRKQLKVVIKALFSALMSM